METTITFAPDQIYSTAQAGELLGISDSTIRSRKSREKAQLIEGTHWVTQEGSTFWTATGILELAKGSQSEQAQALLAAAGAIVATTAATPSAATPATPTVDPSATPSAASPPETTTDEVAIDVSFLEPLLDATGQSLALEFYRRLPTYVLKHIHRMAKHPTDDERRIIQSAFQPITQLQQEVREQCVS